MEILSFLLYRLLHGVKLMKHHQSLFFDTTTVLHKCDQNFVHLSISSYFILSRCIFLHLQCPYAHGHVVSLPPFNVALILIHK